MIGLPPCAPHDWYCCPAVLCLQTFTAAAPIDWVHHSFNVAVRHAWVGSQPWVCKKLQGTALHACMHVGLSTCGCLLHASGCATFKKLVQSVVVLEIATGYPTIQSSVYAALPVPPAWACSRVLATARAACSLLTTASHHTWRWRPVWQATVTAAAVHQHGPAPAPGESSSSVPLLLQV
jgi:hypothetical protein